MKTTHPPADPAAHEPGPASADGLAGRVWQFFKVMLVWVFDLLSWMWLLRIPLLGICILQLLAHMNRVNLIRGGFEAKSAMTMLLMGFIVYFFVWAMRMVCCLTVRYGPLRFGVPHLKAPAFLASLAVDGPGVFFWSLVGVYPLYVCWQVGYADSPQGAPTGWAWWKPWLAMAAGWALAYVLYAAVVLLQRLGQVKLPPRPKGAPAVAEPKGEVFDLWLPTARLRSVYQRAKEYTLDAPPEWMRALMSVCLWLLNLIPQEFGLGFLYYDKDGRVSVVAPGIIASMVAGLVGMLIFWWFHNFVAGLQDPPPAIFYVIWLLAMMCWFFGFAAFLLDRWRLPSVCIFIGLFCWVGHTNPMDYSFVVRRTTTEPPRAGQILRRQIEQARGSAKPGEKPMPRIILVAAEGGGIHSGTWVTHVLGKLAQQFPTPEGAPVKNPFKDSIILVSGVSGGSYGLMYWLDSYLEGYDDAPPMTGVVDLASSPTKGPAKASAQTPATVAGAEQAPPAPTAQRLQQLLGRDVHFLPRTHAQRDSLSATVRGLVFRDLWVNVLPKYFLGPDRGTAIQQRWAEKLNLKSTCKNLGEYWLSDWADLAGRGAMPAALFNSTSQETGLPVVFGTSSFSSPREDEREFRNRRVKSPAAAGQILAAEDQKAAWWLDTPVTAAVRMSSTFSWVLPMARPEMSEAQKGDPLPFNPQHLADGGYYDNFGMSSLIRWLDSALREYEEDGTKDPSLRLSEPLEILVVQIWDETTTTQKAGDTRPTDHGMIYQAGGPLSLLVNQRSYSHSVRNLQEYNLLRDKWGKSDVARIHTACFEFPFDDAALSWHLTDKQLQQIIRIPLTPGEQEINASEPLCQCLVNELNQNLDSIRHEPICSQGRNQAVVLQECREELRKRLSKLAEATEIVQTYLKDGRLPTASSK